MLTIDINPYEISSYYKVNGTFQSLSDNNTILTYTIPKKVIENGKVTFDISLGLADGWDATTYTGGPTTFAVAVGNAYFGHYMK